MRINLIISKIIYMLRWKYLKARYFGMLRSRGRVRIEAGFKMVNLNDSKSLRCDFGGGNFVGRNCLFQGSGRITFGTRSFCGEGVVIGCNSEVKIGDDVMIAQYVTIRDTDHVIDRVDIPMIEQGIVSNVVTIEDDVWIGHGVSILKGVTVRRGSVIAAGAVVNKSVDAYGIYGGVPARLIKKRKSGGENE